MKKRVLHMALLCGSIPTLFAGPMSLNTGTASWQVAYEGGSATSALVLTTNPPSWVQIPGASWVGSTANDGNFTPTVGRTGNYVYTFNIGQLFGGPGGLSFQYAGDNTVSWSITDGWLGGGTTCTDNSCFTTARTVVGAFSATSVLTARILNEPLGLNPTGLIVNGAASDVPEPGSTLAMAGAAFATFAIFRRRLR